MHRSCLHFYVNIRQERVLSGQILLGHVIYIKELSNMVIGKQLVRHTEEETLGIWGAGGACTAFAMWISAYVPRPSPEFDFLNL